MARVLSLSGLGTRDVTDGGALRAVHLAAFAGILSSQVRNAQGLRNLLSVVLGEIAVTVEEFVPRWVTIPERSQLGRTGSVRHILGMTSSLGRKVRDISGKFRIVLGPLSLAQYINLLPGGGLTMTVRYMVRLYIRDALAYDVHLRLKTAEIPPLRLGDRTLKVGFTTWLGRPRTETTSRLVDYDAHSNSLIPSGVL
jgi:type VI secretion system protein ImpH